MQSLTVFFPTPKASAASWYRCKSDVLAVGKQDKFTKTHNSTVKPSGLTAASDPNIIIGVQTQVSTKVAKQILFCADEMMKNKSRGDK